MRRVLRDALMARGVHMRNKLIKISLFVQNLLFNDNFVQPI